MKNFLPSFVKSGLGVILSAIFGLLLLRLISQDLGVEGIAIFGIYRQFIQFCTVFLSWGNGFAIIESYSKSSNKSEFTTIIFKYTLAVTLGLGLFILLIHQPITGLLFADASKSYLILLSPLIFLGLANYSFFRFILTAEKNLLLSSLLQALPFILMLISFNLSANFSLIFLFSYLLSALIAFVAWRFKSEAQLDFKYEFKRLTEFEKTSIATMITGAVGFFSPLIVKAISVHYLGLSQTGVIEAEFSLISYFTLAIISGLGTFYLGQVSEAPKDINLREKTFLFLIPITAIALTVLVFFQDFFLGILFGKEILQYQPSLSLFAIGELLRCANWFFIFSMIGLSYRRTYIKLDVI
jgi:O-antigen/teichoic acid export membrane protein